MMGFAGLELTSASGKEIPVDAEGASFQCRDAAERFCVVEFSRSAEGHGSGKVGASGNPHGDATFEVGGDDERELRFTLQAVEKDCGFIWSRLVEEWRVVRDGDNERADVIFGDAIAKFLEVRVVVAEEFSLQARHEELADLLFQGKFLESLFGPLLSVLAEVGRAGLQKFVFGENGRGQEQHYHQQKRFAHLQTIARESWVGFDGTPLEDQGVRLDEENPPSWDTTRNYW